MRMQKNSLLPPHPRSGRDGPLTPSPLTAVATMKDRGPLPDSRGRESQPQQGEALGVREASAFFRNLLLSLTSLFGPARGLYNESMLTRETLESDLRSAMKAGDEPRKRTLRMLLSALKLAEVERKSALDETTLVAITQKEIKTRREAIEDARRAGRQDLVASSEAEIAILQAYLPQPLTAEELQALALVAIQETSAAGPQDMGKVMKVLMPRIQGRVDGKTASEVIRALLNRA